MSQTAKNVRVFGCGVAIGVGVLLLWIALGRWLAGFIGLLVALAVGIFANEQWKRFRLTQSFRQVHGVAGKDLLLVYSDSPHWGQYIEQHWLSRWSDRAVTLNRSRRWSEEQVEARLWRQFAGGRDHTPIALVIPKRGRVTVVRFWRAFRDYKHGKTETLRQAEARLEAAMARSGTAES